MNLIPKICELLGVEIGEEFKIAGNEMNIFHFDEHRGLLVRINEMHDYAEPANGEKYAKLLNGFSKIVKLPFEPKDGETYYFVSWYTLEPLHADKATWKNEGIDYKQKYCGNVFRTEAEAEAHKYEIYEKLTGKKWEEK